MIKATTRTFPDGVRVDRLCNKGQWFGETYLIGIGMGFDTYFVVAEGGCEQDALDAYADSKQAGLTEMSDEDVLDHMVDNMKRGDWYNLERSEIKALIQNKLDNNKQLPDEVYEGIEYLGNYSKSHDLTELRVLERCKVDYFAKDKEKVRA